MNFMHSLNSFLLSLSFSYTVFPRCCVVFLRLWLCKNDLAFYSLVTLSRTFSSQHKDENKIKAWFLLFANQTVLLNNGKTTPQLYFLAGIVQLNLNHNGSSTFFALSETPAVYSVPLCKRQLTVWFHPTVRIHLRPQSFHWPRVLIYHSWEAAKVPLGSIRTLTKIDSWEKHPEGPGLYVLTIKTFY